MCRLSPRLALVGEAERGHMKTRSRLTRDILTMPSRFILMRLENNLVKR